MSNWFENSPAKSIVVYTLVIAGTVWAASRFVFSDNRLDAYRAQLESARAEALTLQARIDYLEAVGLEVRRENDMFRNAVSSSPQSLAYLSSRLTWLESQVVAKDSAIAMLTARPASGGAYGSWGPHRRSYTVMKGHAIADSVSQLVVGVRDVNVDREAFLYITIPGREPVDAPRLPAGWQQHFTLEGRNFVVRLMRVDFIASVVIIEVVEDDPSSPPATR